MKRKADLRKSKNNEQGHIFRNKGQQLTNLHPYRWRSTINRNTAWQMGIHSEQEYFSRMGCSVSKTRHYLHALDYLSCSGY